MEINKLSSPGTYSILPKDDSVDILVLADLHLGSKDFDYALWDYYQEWLDNNPDVYIMLNGDLIEAGQRNSVGNSVYNSILNPQEQVEAAEKVINKYKDRIICITEGNHELRIRRQTGINPIKLITPSHIIYEDYNNPVKLRILGKNIWMHHGKGSSTTESSKITKAKRLWSFRPDIDLQIYSHWHSYFEYYQVTKDFIGNNKDRIMVVTGSTLKWEGSYAEASYSPGRLGFPLISIQKDTIKITRISPEEDNYKPNLGKNTKLSNEEVMQLRDDFSSGTKQTYLATKYNISIDTVKSITSFRRR